ncbi:MAG TPA: FAD-dependent oxidoreductase, partial [Thermoanaerobaculia bacterium]|nr:FAD-dependent oxidoreductase [Thermoanaerobaculia bacterium]
MTEILIIGAGVVGASVAFHLAQRGVRDILVVDRAGDLGAGSTAKATGGFRAQFDNETEIRLSLLARDKLRNFRDEVGADPGYAPHGYLFLAMNDAELDALRRTNTLQRACGLTEARIVSEDEIRAINPAIEQFIGGAFCPTDGFLAPMNILRGYADAARRLGVRFAFGVDEV